MDPLTVTWVGTSRIIGVHHAGCSKRPSSEAAGESKPEAYPLGYVEDVGEPRTTREVVFSILWEARAPFENSMRIQAFVPRETGAKPIG